MFHSGISSTTTYNKGTIYITLFVTITAVSSIHPYSLVFTSPQRKKIKTPISVKIKNTSRVKINVTLQSFITRSIFTGERIRKESSTTRCSTARLRKITRRFRIHRYEDEKSTAPRTFTEQHVFSSQAIFTLSHVAHRTCILSDGLRTCA